MGVTGLGKLLNPHTLYSRNVLELLDVVFVTQRLSSAPSLQTTTVDSLITYTLDNPYYPIQQFRHSWSVGSFTKYTIL